MSDDAVARVFREESPRILAMLEPVRPSPVVSLNRAVAVAMAEGPAAGLALLEGLDDALAGFHLLPAARADLLRRLARWEEAAAEYRRALELAPSGPERRFLARRLRDVETRG